MEPLILHLSTAASVALLASLWQTAVLAILLALALRLLPRYAPALRYALWAALLPIALALPLVSLAVRSTPSPLSTHPLLRVDSRWSLAVAGLWLLLSLARGAHLLFSARRLRSVARQAVPVNPSPLPPDALSTGNGRVAILCTSSVAEITQPSVIGFHAPRILIPAWMYAGLSPVELRQIVLHEMEHLRRRDDWLNLAQKLALVLFPLNPVLIWVERRLCRERELACDDGVLRVTDSPKIYATCLVHLAEQRLSFRQMPLALGAWARRSELASRVERILDARSNRRSTRPQAMLAAGTLLLSLLGGSAALSHGPRLIAFSPAAQTAAQTAAHTAAPFAPTADLALPNPTSSLNAAHMTLLKAEMPMRPRLPPVDPVPYEQPPESAPFGSVNAPPPSPRAFRHRDLLDRSGSVHDHPCRPGRL